eukprot:1159311-Pelagomonas_calceolata.AAC.2
MPWGPCAPPLLSFDATPLFCCPLAAAAAAAAAERSQATHLGAEQHKSEALVQAGGWVPHNAHTLNSGQAPIGSGCKLRIAL